MARKSKKGRPVNGILILDKPSGITSNAALQKVKWLYQAQKAGHTGSLDPLATGVLPICLGEATKVSHFLLDADKRYRAKCILGAVTTTGDSEGEVLHRAAVPELDKSALLKVFEQFTGAIKQTPPMYSALKHNGRPLYEYARKGIEIERKAREITIFELSLIDFEIHPDNPNRPDFIIIEVYCSKGTYIRSLCEDIGKVIGCGAYISELRRLESGPFKLSNSISIDELTEKFGKFDELDEKKQLLMDNLLQPTDLAVMSFPSVELDEIQRDRIEQGQRIDANSLLQDNNSSDYYRLYFNKILIGLAILDEDNKLKPKRLLFL